MGRAAYRRAGSCGCPPTPPSGNAAAVLGWGAGNVGSSTATRFLFAWYDDSLAETAESGFRVPRAGTIRDLHLRQRDAGGNGNALVYTLRVNGADTAMLVSMASTANVGADTSNSVVVSAGDLVSIKVTKAASIGTSPRSITASAELT